MSKFIYIVGSVFAAVVLGMIPFYAGGTEKIHLAIAGFGMLAFLLLFWLSERAPILMDGDGQEDDLRNTQINNMLK